MKNTIGIVRGFAFTSVLAIFGLVLGQDGIKVAVVRDASEILKGNITRLSGCRIGNVVNGKGEDRYEGSFYDQNNSKYSIYARWNRQDNAFSLNGREVWIPKPMASGFSLGRSMSYLSDVSVVVVGDRCEVAVSSYVRSNGVKGTVEENDRALEEITPRAFALIQYQALKEMNIPNTYQLLNSAKFGATFKFESDNCQFTLTSKKGVTRGCVGSLDIFVDGKKLKLKNPVLLDEAGIVRVDQDFLKLIQ